MKNKKLKILIDVDVISQTNKSGVGYYTQQLLCELAKVDPENIEIVGHYFDFLGKSKPMLPEIKNVNYIVSKLMPRKLMNLFRRLNIPIPYELVTLTKPNFIIFPNFLSRFTIFNTPYAPVIYDFTYLDHPEYVSEKNRNDLKNLIPKIIRKANFIITISHASKKRLLYHYPKVKVPIIAELLNLNNKNDYKISVNKKLISTMSKPYILFVGNLEPRKNLINAIKAYYLLPQETKDKFNFLIVGGNAWEKSLNLYFPDISKDKNIIFCGYVSDQDKNYIYSKASVFLFPSFYEGYGMPIVEAMYHNIPIICSDLEVLREVAKNAASYFNPKNPKDIATKLNNVLNNSSLQKKLIENSNSALLSLNKTNLAELIINQIRKNVS